MFRFLFSSAIILGLVGCTNPTDRGQQYLDGEFNALLNPVDETIVCRCEEITAGTIRELVDQGCLGPNQTKAFGRCGMGPCQGRQCGLTVAEIIAARRGVDVEEVGYYTVRPPIKPVTLGELATVDQSPESHSTDEHGGA